DTALFDLESDISEQHDISSDHLNIVLRLKTLAQQARKNLGDHITQIKGLQVRPPGTLPKNP
ncbi:MAG: arylsulfatase, partial [Planctomycetes bacterium]|nr:arylsulfatase [Planctomycetota bacterium]